MQYESLGSKHAKSAILRFTNGAPEFINRTSGSKNGAAAPMI